MSSRISVPMGGKRAAIWKILAPVALPVTLIALWWVVSSSSTSFYWPPLREILAVFPETWFNGRFQSDVLPSLGRLALGFSLALLLGIGLGVAIGLSRPLRAFCEPTLEFLRAIPPPVMIPVFILFFGIGDGMKVLVIASGCLWPVLLNTIEGVRALDSVLADTCLVFRFSRASRIRSFVIRGASPQVFAGAKQSLSIGIILMVVSEMFAASNGLGFTVVQFQRSFAIPQMWSGIIVLGALGVVLALTFRLVERVALSWYVGLRGSQRKG